MISWLIALIVCLLVWGMLWKSNVRLAFGITIGVVIAMILSLFIRPLLDVSMEDFPIWLPPLPLATVAIVLFVYGALVWLRGNEGLKDKKHDDHEQH